MNNRIVSTNTSLDLPKPVQSRHRSCWLRTTFAASDEAQFQITCCYCCVWLKTLHGNGTGDLSHTRMGAAGLVVMGEESRSRGWEFESLFCRLDGSFFTFIRCENCIIVWKDKNIQKRDRDGPVKNNVSSLLLLRNCWHLSSFLPKLPSNRNKASFGTVVVVVVKRSAC